MNKMQSPERYLKPGGSMGKMAGTRRALVHRGNVVTAPAPPRVGIPIRKTPVGVFTGTARRGRGVGTDRRRPVNPRLRA